MTLPVLHLLLFLTCLSLQFQLPVQAVAQSAWTDLIGLCSNGPTFSLPTDAAGPGDTSNMTMCIVSSGLSQCEVAK